MTPRSGCALSRFINDLLAIARAAAEVLTFCVQSTMTNEDLGGPAVGLLSAEGLYVQMVVWLVG